MQISVPTETAPHELRVALTPDSVARLVKAGLQAAVQRGAGERAGFTDEAYVAAGATIAPDFTSAVAGAAMVTKVQPPSEEETARLAPNTVLVSLMQPGRNDGLPARLAARKVTALALELVPRITRAQSMDVLSSQSTVAGYKAVLVGAAELDKFLPMLTTAAGNVPPAKAFVIGAGVAGLQAIATARRLGGQVSAFDVRPAAREQVLSLGATFVAADLAAPGAEAAGGYARAQTDEERQRTQAALATHIAGMDLVITTAQIPGRPAPRLITAQMVHSMRPGAVIVDLAAESGGNCELTRPGQTVVERGVRILGPLNLAATLPHHASQMFGRNVLALVNEVVKDGKIDLSGEIASAMVVTNENRS
jgi:H+-translocating NAD(P) transhydrogenase subunit alpha